MKRGLVVLGLFAALQAWLWPIGLGGKMPVGGDVTQFSIGLMAVFQDALRSLHLPLWNERWGYGFPGVGESQMGVFYPPHWLLYGLLPLEAAYTAGLVAHSLWGGLGASWCARRFGVSRVGAFLSGFAWMACGFALIHLPHHWAAATGCWMPWAWGLAWWTLDGGGRRPALGLAAVLALQLLPGHFQLAFTTQASVLALVVARVSGERTRWWWGLLVLAGVAGAFLLAAGQVVPTLRLARLAAPRRDFEYLSGFAATPLHLVTFVAPGLFERSPLWRPVVWDPLHTSPEEYLGYVGLAPLFLAVLAVRRGWRGSPAVRALTAAGLVSLWLALGPYVPGFRLLCQLPGFSFFRAPARWTLALSLALALLAGQGLDTLLDARAFRRAAGRFAIGVVLAVGLAVGLVELALLGSETRGATGAAAPVAWLLDHLPWGESGVFARAMAEARKKNRDPRVSESLARQGVVLRDAPPAVFAERRASIYPSELAPTVLLLVGLLLISTQAGHPGRLRAGLLALTLLDLLALGRQRRVDLGPIASLTAQSPLLARLGAAPGTRTLDPLRNLPMVAGAAPVSAYRTLDLPVLEAFTATAASPALDRETSSKVVEAGRLIGARLKVYEPRDRAELARRGVEGLPAIESVRDPALAGWRYGVDWVAQAGPEASTFGLSRNDARTTGAWLIPLTSDRRDVVLGEAVSPRHNPLLGLAAAVWLIKEQPDPEHRVIGVRATQPSLVVVAELADPEWEGTWTGPGGTSPAPMLRAFGRSGQGAWQAYEVPKAGVWRLDLTYRGRDVRAGLALSALSWAVWVGLWSGALHRLTEFKRRD